MVSKSRQQLDECWLNRKLICNQFANYGEIYEAWNDTDVSVSLSTTHWRLLAWYDSRIPILKLVFFFFFLSRNLGWRLSNSVINHNSAFPSVIVAHVSGESHKKYDGKCIKKKTKIPSVCNGLVLYVCHWHQKDLFLEKVS